MFQDITSTCWFLPGADSSIHPWLTSGLNAAPMIDFHVPYLPPQTYFFTMSTPATTVTSISPTVARIIGTEFDLEFLIN